jgi:hypothetical protein
MTLALNAIQTNTDGSIYRRDRIPACTLRECLERCPDYPAKHVGEGDGIPFIDPQTIPQDEASFIEWYRRHVLRFFEAHENSELGRLLGLHRLAHKTNEGSQQIAFDGLACWGVANYVKCVKDGSSWSPVGSAIRAYRKESQKILAPWIIATVTRDRIDELPPITADMVLLKPKEAIRLARTLQRFESVSNPTLPMGYEHLLIRQLRLIQLSAFLFETPAQARAVRRAVEKIEAKLPLGLTRLALRGAYGDRPARSVSGAVLDLEEFVRTGKTRIDHDLHLSRATNVLFAEEANWDDIATYQRFLAKFNLRDRIDPNGLPWTTLLTGIALPPFESHPLRQRTA